MFKSIEYKLIIYLVLFAASVVGLTMSIVYGQYVYGIIAVVALLFFINKLFTHYNKFNKNILFLLNALDNGDYSFNFSETKLSRREKELNNMMNNIKDILVKARQDVIQNEKFQSLIVESVSTGIIILDENNNVLIANRATNQILGLPVFTHLNQLKVVDESFPQMFRELQEEDTKQIKIVNDREEIQVSVRSSKMIMHNGTLRIISLSNIGNELEAKEMESWIRLIRVMTHEIMNSIAPITSLSETLLFSYRMTDLDSREDLQSNTIEALETINLTAKGLMNFVDSYRKFTGIPQPQINSIDIASLLEKVVMLETPLLEEKGIDIELNIDCKDRVLLADESQITQILVNLVKNAAEAIGISKEGRIILEVSDKNGKTNILIKNNGEPIPEDVAPHIFIPFFTTKDFGTGIGLSVSRYIMRLHGGNLKHHTEGVWTVFSMAF